MNRSPPPCSLKFSVVALLLWAGCAHSPKAPLPPVPQRLKAEVAVSSGDCTDRVLRVEELTPFRDPGLGGTPILSEVIGHSKVELRLDGTRIGGVVFDALANVWRALPEGGPRLEGKTTAPSPPVVMGPFVAFLPGSGYRPTPSLFDPSQHRWVDLSAGAPFFGDFTRPQGGEGQWFVWSVKETYADFANAHRVELQTARWTKLPPAHAPSRRYAAAVVQCGDALFVFGGVPGDGGADALGDGAVFRASTGAWAPLPAERAPRRRFSAFAGCSGDAVVLFGGNEIVTNERGAREGVPTNDGAIFDLRSGEWAPIPTLPIEPGVRDRWGGRWDVSVHAGRLVLTAPDTQETYAAIFDLGSGAWLPLLTAPIASADRSARVGVDSLVFLGLAVRSSASGPGFGATEHTPYPPSVALLDVGAGTWCTWTLPHVGPFAIPHGHITFRFGPLLPTSDGVINWGTSTTKLPDPCPVGAACLPSKIEHGGIDATARLRWEPSAPALQPR